MRWKPPILIACLMSLAMGAVSLAQIPAPGGPFSSTLAIQNISGTTANCTHVFYNGAGASAYTSSSTAIAAGQSQVVDVSGIGSLSTGTYAGVVTCDQQVAAITIMKDTDSEAAYRGFTDVGTTLYAPGIYKNYYGFYSDIVVQNVGASNIDMTVTIYAQNNPVAVATQNASNVAPNAAASFLQSGLAGVNTNVPHSAVIRGFLAGTSTPASIAAIVNIYGSNDGAGSGQPNTTPELYSYNAFASGGTTWYAPVIMNNYYGWNTALTIQNVGASNASVTVNYSNGASASNVVAPNSAWAIYSPNQAGLPGGGIVVFGATVTSNQPVVTIVNESNTSFRAATYTGLLGGGATAYGPLVVRTSSYDSSVTCQNLGSVATNMTLQYVGTATSVTKTNIQPSSTALWYSPNDVGLGFSGSVTVTTNNGQPIGCIVNRSKDSAPAGIDNLSAYEATTP